MAWSVACRAVLGLAASVSMMLGCVRPPALWFEKDAEEARSSFDASGIQRLSLAGGVARVSIAPGADDSVRVVVSLRSRDQERLREKCIPGSRLEHDVEAGTMALRLRQSGRDHCGETWTVVLPARLFVLLEFANAEVDVSGIRGGLSASISGTGKVTASVDSGPASVTMGVGDVHVIANRASVGDLVLESEVGRAELTLHGVRVPVAKRGSSSRIATRGTGSQDIRLRTRVGNVSLTVNAQAER